MPVLSIQELELMPEVLILSLPQLLLLLGVAEVFFLPLPVRTE